MSDQVLSYFEDYQRSRVNFVHGVAELALRPSCIEMMTNAGVMSLLQPLLTDQVPSVQHTAAIAVGRLANYNEELAGAVVENNMLPHLVSVLKDSNRFHKRGASYVLRSVAKHNAELAKSVVDAGALDALVLCLDEFDPAVKEGAAWALGYVAMHSGEMAQAIFDTGACKFLVQMLREPEVELKRIAAGVLSDLSKHNGSLAMQVVNDDAITYLLPLINYPDFKLQRQVCACLAHISKHSLSLAERVVAVDVFTPLMICLQSENLYVRRNAATCLRELSRHTEDLSRNIVNAGGAVALVDYVSDTKGNARLPGIMAIGYIAAFSASLAQTLISSNAVSEILNALLTESEDHIKAAAAWTLGQIGRHSEKHAIELAQSDVYRNLIAVIKSDRSSENLKEKASQSLKQTIAQCNNLDTLQPLLVDAPLLVQEFVLKQFSIALPQNKEGRKSFVESGALQFVQQLAIDNPGLSDLVESVNECFPSEVVNYYSPTYATTLMKALDDYTVPAV